MSGFTGLVDTLLADRLAPRLVDALRLPSVGAVPEPAPVSATRPVANDVRLLQQALGQPALPLAAAAPGAAPAPGLSAAGVAISELLAGLPAPAPVVRGAAPLAADSAAGAMGLGRSLALALAGSGLFYESHLAQLAGGALEIARLRQEPQAAWRWPGSADEDHEAADGASARPARLDAPGAPEPRAEVVPAQARALVAQQLELLATGVFRWSGEAWPGVPLEWSVQEDAADGAGAEAGALPRRWSTTLRLTLPQLGAVEVRLTLAARELRARVCAAQPAVAPLRAAQDELPAQLAELGLALPEVAIVAAEAP